MNEENLSKFTDVIDEICDSQPVEICDSQPLSLTSSNNTPPPRDPLPKSYRPAKCTGQIGNFRSVEEIDPKYQHVFTYRYFNLVQSSVIEDALYSNKSIVVCAPTGSGKTVVFEMAIVQLLMELEDKNYTDDFKIIYMAPVKALCTERLTEWHSKFTKLGLLCIEVTGDTDVEFSQLKPYRIIITTPEKWDMLTRRWRDYRGLVEVVKLFLIDEVHILNDEVRGPVLEAVVSRMKTIETSVQSAYRIEQLQAQFQGANVQGQESPPRVRFVAVSATVSNPEDVAAWLGNSEQPAAYYKFGDECRPVKLKRVVEGYQCPVGTSIFKFDIILNYKLWPIIQKYHNGKPTLIFCNTRKGVVLTAETLSREITVSFNEEQKTKLVALASTLKNKKVQSLVLCGIGCHHAGLLYEERTNIEQAFRNRDLPILITTTTLAMGVNLPAHLVIIKNTQQYVNGAYQEYSISTVLQMVGRAGRPQYDTEATAVIMTRLQDKARYQALVGGCEPLQSYLHKRLAENLNSEAALGTVGDVAQCVQWVNSTFLSVRAARDPKRYLNLPPAAPAELISKKIEELCVRAMNGLASAGLITMDEVCCIESTEAGRLMSLCYLDLETMKLIMMLEGTESLERLLWLVCESHELADMHLRVDERRCLNALNRNNAAATIRFPMKGKINSRQMKLNCIIQAVLGCLPIPDPSLNQEAMKIMRTADRVCKCLVSYVTRPNLISQNPKYSAILNSLILAKCISARLWENSPYVCRQLTGIGPTYSTLLASAGKTNFMVLEESHPRDLERIMNKGPPAGNILRKQISLLPKYNLTMTPVNEKIVRIQLSLLNLAHLSENMENLTAGVNHKSYVVVGDSENFLLYFTTFKESDLISVYDGCMTFEVTRKHTNEHKIFAHCISSTIVGIDEKCEYLFMDINPLPEKNINDRHISLHEALEKRHHMSQPTITDVFKERKRKIFNQNDTIQSKEKRKRDMNLVDTFKSLKESLEKTAEEIKEDFTKKSDISHNLLQNLTKTNSPLNKDSSTTISHVGEYQYLEKAFSEDFGMEDIDIDEEQIKDILNDIENEIKDRKPNNSVSLETEPKSPKHNQFSYFLKSDPVKYNCKKHADPPKNMYMPANRRKLNTNNNYTFLDNLEKKDSNDYNITTETKVDTGFSKTVQSQINKYLQRAQAKLKIKNPIIVDVIDSSNTKFNNIRPRDSTNLTKDEPESLQCCKDKMNTNDQIKSIVNYENKLQLNAKMDKFNDNPKDSIDLTIDESLRTYKDETYNNNWISNSIDNDENQLHLNSEKDQFHKTNDSPKLSILKNKKLNLQSLSNFTPRQCLEIMPCNEATNKIVKSTEHQENNLKEITLKDTDKDDLQKGQNKNRKYSISTFLPKLNVAPSNFPIPVNNEAQIIAQVNNQPDVVGKKLIHENTNNFHDQRDTNYSESNTFEMPTTEENIEKISTFSFGKTKTFNFHTQNSSKQRVQIISNIKVDLDFTKIVYKKDKLSPKSNEINTNTKYDDNPKIVAIEAPCQTAISGNDYYSKVTMRQNSTNKRLKMNSCLSNGTKRNSAFVQIIKSNNDYKGNYSKINTYENNLPLQNDDKYCYKYMIYSGDNKENETSVMDGLQKHGNTVKRQKNSVHEIQKINRGSCNIQNSNVIIAKSSRKCKSMEADDVQTHANQSLTVGKKNTVSQKALAQRDNLMETVTSKNDLKIQRTTQNHNNYTETVLPYFNIRKNIEEDNRPIRMHDVMFTHSNSTHDFSVKQDNDEIITPPPEFCDNNPTNSSTFRNDFHNNKLSPENSDKQYLTGNLSEIELKSDLSQEANIMSTTLDKVTNIESISDYNETISKVNNFHDNKDTITSKDTSNNGSAKDILQKYSNIFKRQKNSVHEIQKINRGSCNSQNSNVIIAKSNRKYKIMEADDVQNHANQSLTVGKKNTVSQKALAQRDNLMETITSKNDSTLQQTTQNPETVLPHFNIRKNIEEDNRPIRTLDDMFTHSNSTHDFNVNQDNDEIIAPPPEFCDNNPTNSSTFRNDFHYNNLNPENCEKQYLTVNLSEIELKSDLSQEANIMSTTLDKFTNIESISDYNETISKVNNFHNNKDTMTSKDTSNNGSVKDILQKYSNIFKRQKPVVSTNSSVTKINEYENSDSSTNSTMVKSSRQCKIRDIDKIQIPLPQSLTIENHNTASQKFISTHNTVSQDRVTQRDIMTCMAACAEPSEIQQSTLYDNNKQIQDYSVSESDINIDDDAVEEALEILSSDAMLSPWYSANDYDINQTILNPKTLLECINKADKDKTITNPIEFCDDNTSTYSPTYTTDNQNAEEIITQGSKDSHNDLETTLFDNDSVVGLTPSKEVETWTLSQENVKSGSFSFDNMSSSRRYPNSYTSLHKKNKNGIENNRELHKYAHYPNNSRHAKLSYFKFERKRVFKKI